MIGGSPFGLSGAVERTLCERTLPYSISTPVTHMLIGFNMYYFCVFSRVEVKKAYKHMHTGLPAFLMRLRR